jgi:hypothetical protein
MHRLTRASVLVAIVVLARGAGWAQSNPSNAAFVSDAASSPAQPEESQTPNPPSLMTPLRPVTQASPYRPITPRQRLRWFLTNTIGPPHLAAGLFVAGFGTSIDRPPEYGPHLGGFADRYGMRITGIVTGNAIEAGFGMFRGEDPRYFRVPDQPFKLRVKNAARLTFFARYDDGAYGLAYARFAGIVGNNFLSNSWRVHSEANTHDGLLRIGEGFASRMAFNAFEEFWPDIKSRLFRKRFR